MIRTSLIFYLAFSLPALACCSPSSATETISGEENQACVKSWRGCRQDPAPLGREDLELFSGTRVGRHQRSFNPEKFRADFKELSSDIDDSTDKLPWPNRPSPPGATSVVLFIEPYQQPISALGRFRDQVLGRYRYDVGSGRFLADSSIFQLSQKFENLGRLWAKYRPALEWLNTIDATEYFDSRNVKPFAHESVNYHGTFVFDLFAMRSPSTPVVFAEFPKIEELFACHANDTAAQARQTILERLTQLKNEYQNIVRQKKVTDVVITHSFTSATIKGTLQSFCPLLKDQASLIIADLVAFNRSVFQDDHLRVFQAMANDSGKLRTTQDWDLHCLQGDNVFRVSYLSSSRTDIPAFGQALRTLTPPDGQKENWKSGCSQVVINSGFDEVMDYGSGNEGDNGTENDDAGVLYQAKPRFDHRRQSMSAPRIGAFNENTEHKYIMANSWATPIAAALAIHIDANYRAAKGRSPTVADMKRLLNGRIFDPILHKQFEVYFEHEGIEK